MQNKSANNTEQLIQTCILLAWVLMRNTRGYGLSKLHHLGWQETYCRTATEYTQKHHVRISKHTFSLCRLKQNK